MKRATSAQLRSFDCETDAIPTPMSRDEYNKKLAQVDDHLKSSDLLCMKFLTKDLLSQSFLERANRGIDLFQELERQKKLGPHSVWLLLEVLLRLGRVDLIKKLGYTKKEVVSRSPRLLPEFRILLFDICQEITTRKLSELKFLCNGRLPKTALESIKTAEELFIQLEQADEIGEEELDFLLHLLQSIDENGLVSKVQEFNANARYHMADSAPVEHESTTVTGQSEPALTKKKDVPPINSMEEWDQRVRNIYRGEKTIKEITAESVSQGERVPNDWDSGLEPPPYSLHDPLSMQRHEAFCGGTGQGEELSTTSPAADASMPNYPGSPRQEEQIRMNDYKPAELQQHLHQRYRGVQPRDLTQGSVADFISLPNLRGAPQAQVSTAAPIYQCTTGQNGHCPGSAIGRNPYQVGTVQSTDCPLTDSQPTYPCYPYMPHQAHVTHQSSYDSSLCYDMSRRPRGLCLILNNKKFHKVENDSGSRKLPERTGSEIDTGNLDYIFSKLGFIIQTETNLTKQEMIELMRRLAQDEDHNNYDCFVCCVLSHGAVGSVYSSDGREVAIKELTQPFKSVLCTGLRGKPKLFFIQACQGKEKQPGAPGHDLETDAPSLSSEVPPPSQPGVIPTETVPNEADFLLGYATVPGFVSFRSRSQGSWYITKLTEMLDKYAHEHDLLSILVMVNNEVSKGIAPMPEADYKQSPAPLVTLRKKIYFR